MQKRLLFLICFILLFCGCNQKRELVIEGVIEQNKTELISIHYPKTGIEKLDKEISTYISNTRTNLEQYIKKNVYIEDIPELNIDYEYKVVGNRYSNIVLTTFFTSPLLAHPIHEIKTFVFDQKENKFLYLSDIAPINIGKIKTELLKQHQDCILLENLETTFQNPNALKFTFTDHSIRLYFSPYEIASGNCGIIKYEFPNTKFNILLEKDSIQNTSLLYQPNKKVLSPFKPTIALTFDDGPSKYTKEIVKLLNEYEANATFFILGNKVENYHDTLAYVLKSGNELGNHSYNHKKLTKLSSKELHNQIEMTNNIVKKTLNYDIRLLRPTYGATSGSLKSNIDMEIVLWNVDTQDWKLRNSKKIYEKALHDIKDGKIVLMHDIYKSTLESLKLLLPELKKRGYQIVTVSELKQIQEMRHEKK